jgi:hypothetical protein
LHPCIWPSLRSSWQPRSSGGPASSAEHKHKRATSLTCAPLTLRYQRGPTLVPCPLVSLRAATAQIVPALLARISHHGSGRAGLQPRLYKAFLIIPASRTPRSPAPAGLRGVRDQQRAGAAIPAGLKPRPSGSLLRASKRGEKSGLGIRPGKSPSRQMAQCVAAGWIPA